MLASTVSGFPTNNITITCYANNIATLDVVWIYYPISDNTSKKIIYMSASMFPPFANGDKFTVTTLTFEVWFI
jgi:hypothetical protein